MAEVWQQRDVALGYLAERAALLPDRGRQLDVLLRLLATSGCPVRRVLDLGAGDGVLLTTVLEAFPEATGVALDFSEPMLEQARVRLAPHAARATVVQADLATPAWSAAVAGPFDAIVSGFAIHHLPHPRKRDLYAEIFALLSEGGAFVNCEHVSSPTPRIERLYNQTMSDHLWQRRRERGEEVTREQVFAEYTQRADRAANILAPVEEQCAWLRDIGFREVDCFWKLFELAIFGGLR
jgi:ubiquinone/menaquinone biosynthesis C-methylase UbiE